LLLTPCAAAAQIRVNPTGVNVNAQGPTTVFLTFGAMADYAPADAFWCGDLIPAAPDVGLKCNPGNLFGQLPLRFDRSRFSGSNAFTDIMSIPTSVVRRAYAAAVAGEESRFFYVRRFVSAAGGPDQYVAVTCRLTGGGARVPFALVDVSVAFESDAPVLFVVPGAALPAVTANISYNGTGRLVGRWEVVQPGEDIPEERDLLTEATLPLEERGTQRRYTEIERFNVFLPPTGRFVLRGPDPARLPTVADGMYMLLLRIEASDDKEGDSNLAAVGAGPGILHNGAVAGFPMPTLRYYVSAEGLADRSLARAGAGALNAILPEVGAGLVMGAAVDFEWMPITQAAYYRVEFETPDGKRILAAIIPANVTTYRAPSWLAERAAGALRWRVVAVNLDGNDFARGDWRLLRAP
jgi:hypothetical protein